jgi:hypothetical protein
MRIIFDGENKKIDQDEFCDMIMFFCGLLLTEEDINKLNLLISFSSEKAEPGCVGLCEQLDDYDFTIWIRKSKSIPAQIDTLAHELVHVKQYIRGEMDDDGNHTNPLIQAWGGCGSYEESSTEIEAYGRTHGLINRYHTFKQGKTND